MKIKGFFSLLWIFILGLIFFPFIGIWYFILLISLYLFSYISRRWFFPHYYEYDFIQDQAMISPVSGRVDDIIEVKDRVIVKISTGVFDHCQIYYCLSSVVKDISRVKDNGMNYIDKFIIDGDCFSFSLKTLAFFTSFKILPGDKIKKGAPIGHATFGAKTMLSFDKNIYSLMINKNERVRGGISPVAFHKDI